MEQEQIDMIKSYYDKQGEYKINHRYSGEQGAVYTRAGDTAHWLVIERKGENGAEVRLTDGTGRITARDTYEVIGGKIKCVQARRAGRENKNIAEFDPDEINLIHQYGKGSRQGTMDALKNAMSKAGDGDEKKRIRGAIYKLSILPEQNCQGLIRGVSYGNMVGRDSSIRSQIRNTKKNVNNRADVEKKKTECKKKNGLAL